MKYWLKVYQHGRLIQELEMTPDRDYIAGRGKTCDIVLEGGKGISRQHIKFSFAGENWEVNLTSKFGALIFEGENCESIVLDGDAQFVVPPFEFHYAVEEDEVEEPVEQHDVVVPEDEIKTKESDQKPKTNLFSAEGESSEEPQSEEEEGGIDIQLEPQDDEPDQPLENPPTPAEAKKQEESFQGNMESTDPGISTLDVFLEAKYTNGDKEVFRLEGNLWVAGRDSSCEVFLRDDHISRRHFELTQTHDGFYVTDLGSSNGTYINRKKLKPHTPTLIQSGDRLKIKRVRVKFKVVDNKFNENLHDIQDTHLMVPKQMQALQPVAGGDPAAPQQPFQAPMMFEGPAVVRLEDNQEFSLMNMSTWEGKHKFRAGIVVLLVAMFGLFGGESPDQKTKEQSMASSAQDKNNPLAQLTPAQRESIKINYNLAQQLRRQEKYSLCLAKIDQIHTFVPSHKDSKKIESTCKIGLDVKREKAQKEELERIRQKNLAKVNVIISECRAQLQGFQTVQEIDSCLQPAIEIDPGNPEYESLRIVILEREKAAQDRQVAAQRRESLTRQGVALFQKAKRTFDQNKLQLAIKQLNDYLASTYPDPSNNKAKARKMIATARTKFDQIINSGLVTCKQLADQTKYAEADKACNKVLEQDKSNQEAKLIKRDMRDRLSKKMKEIYENASIEENFGNIEAANELWQKILSEDFPGGTVFYERAKRKKEKYGL